MLATKTGKTAETRRIESLLRQHFAKVDCYRYNPAAIRIRIVDDRFDGLDWSQREALVNRLLLTLPEETQLDVTMLVMVTEEEMPDSSANFEFDHPGDLRP